MIKIIRYVRNYYFHIALAALACIGASAATVMLIDFLKNLVDGTAGNSFWQTAGILVVGICSNYLTVYMTGRIGAGVLKDLRTDCINGVLKAAPSYVGKCSRGDIMERVSSDVEGLAGFITGYFKDCLYVPIMVVVYSVYLFGINPFLAAGCLIPLAVLVPINVKCMKPIKLKQFEYMRELGFTNNYIQEAFDGVETVKAYNLQQRMQKKYHSAMHRLLGISNATDLKQYNLEPISAAIQSLPVVVAFVMGGVLVFKGQMTIGVLIAYISVLRNLVAPLSMCYQLVVRSQTAIVSIQRVFEVIDMPWERESGAVELKKTDTAIEFENVSFSYNTENKDTLNNISFKIKSGTHVAFIGKSGNGKSTILKLIAAFLESNEGVIKIFDRSYSELAPETIRKKIAYMSQDAVLFPLSVRENIRLGNPSATEEQIDTAIRMAGCESFADTVLAEHGSNLSGGQRQRLAMARAIAKDADIYLFDEPTSALDSETERIICKTIAEMPRDKTVITVTHKPSVIEEYDVVYKVEGGRLCGI